jgi:uncharacterized protein YjbI with pentapeptide repeats
MGNPDDIKRAEAGPRVWNAWALEHRRDGTSHDVDFSGATLTVASFDDFIFPGAADFSGASFQRRVGFKRAKFAGVANFTRATFEGGAIFTSAQFHGDAFFLGAKFCARACLDRMRFRKDASLNNTEFRQSAYLAHTVFDSYANFRCAVFQSRLVLTNATFKGETRFDRASINDGFFNSISVTHHILTFRKATFSKVPDFRASQFLAPPNMEGADVHYHVANFTNESRPLRAIYRLGERAGRAEDAAKFRRLKELSNSAKDHERELDFFAKELKAKRFYETRGFFPIVLSMAYQFLADFGKSIERPAFWLGLLTIFAGGILSFRYSPIDANAASGVLLLLVASLLFRLDGGKDPWASWMMLLGAISFLWMCAPAALMLSLSNSVPFVGGKWVTSCEPIAAIRNGCNFRGWPIVLAGLQSAFSLLLLFLIGLGLRNRFRIGGN